jgi:ADP-Ribosyltransferase in polyvalent proteins
MLQPWLDDTQAANGRPIHENFAQWFGQSKATDTQGAPLTLFHSTFSEFDAFQKSSDLGFHFGSAFAANKRVDESALGRARGPDKFNGLNLVPVHLSIENPFHLPNDPVAWEPMYVMTMIGDQLSKRQKERITELSELALTAARAKATEFKEAGVGVRRVKQPWSGGKTIIEIPTRTWIGMLKESRIEVYKEMANAMRAAGFDGLTYLNEIEGQGRTRAVRKKAPDNLTWVAFDPRQIKSALSNSGLYLKHSASLTDAHAAVDLGRALKARQAIISEARKEHSHAHAMA